MENKAVIVFHWICGESLDWEKQEEEMEMKGFCGVGGGFPNFT